MSRPFHTDGHCDCPKPVKPGGDYPDDWIPAAVDYAPPEGHEPADDFEGHALEVMQFHSSRKFDATCMECGFEWPIHVHEDRRDQNLDEWDYLECPHCASEAVVALGEGGRSE